MSTTVLNPEAYLNYWAPQNAYQIEVARNLYLATLGALIWDILVYIPVDIRILRAQRGVRAVNVCFVTSRLFALCYVLLSTLSKTIPLDNCDPMFISIGCCCMLSIWSTSFLFLRRVSAVYSDNAWVKYIFALLWFINGGLEVTVAVGVGAIHAPGTLHCIDAELPHYVIAGGLSPVVFDTLVFLAISYKIGTTHSPMDAKVSWGTLISGKALPRLSRAILQGGQQYYLITAGVYIILVILLGLPSIPPVYGNMFAFPSISLAASMACRVYRNIRLHDFDETTLQPISDLNFARQEPVSKMYTSDSTCCCSPVSTRPRKMDGSAASSSSSGGDGGGAGGDVLGASAAAIGGKTRRGGVVRISEEWRVPERSSLDVVRE